MTKGYNKAEIIDKLSWIFEKEEVKNRPCVFLSHKKEDKPSSAFYVKKQIILKKF